MTKGIPMCASNVLALLNTAIRLTRRWKFNEPAPIDPSKPFKSQTRRIKKNQHCISCGNNCYKPPYAVGDVLYVREALRPYPWLTGSLKTDGIAYAAGYNAERHPVASAEPWPWKVNYLPSIFMPRRLARIWLRVTRVREERLLDITEEDIVCEGLPPNWADAVEFAREIYGDCDGLRADEPRDWYMTLWNGLHGKDAWEQNPLVWVVEFVRIREDRA